MAERLSRGRTKAVAVGRASIPDYRETVRTYFHNLGLELVEVPSARTARPTPARSRPLSTRRPSPSRCSRPNFYGVVGGLVRAARPSRRRRERSRSAVVAEAPRSPCSSRRARAALDIACGEAQSLGVPMHYGGPLARVSRLPRPSTSARSRAGSPA